MTTDCIFCRIIAGEIPTEFLYQDKDVVVFPDIHQQTPVHILIVTRKHIPSLDGLADAGIVARMVEAAGKVAKDKGCSNGYRLVINNGPDGGQVVPHLHLHLLGGSKMPDRMR